MKSDVVSKLEKLCEDYSRIKGRPFAYFYCPILFRDEETPLCKAHIINQAFNISTRTWTIQRLDVDNFYGSDFEADYIAIQYITQHWHPGEIITDKTLSKQFHPRILVDNKPVDFFVAQDRIPENYTCIEIQSGERSVRLGLKMHPIDFMALEERNLEIEINKDVRLPTLVSLIKAAHLTLFEMLGYQYALSAGGYFVGRQILGEFFLQNHNKISKTEIFENGLLFFREFAHFVRPIQFCPFDARGTITDKLLLVCKGNNGAFWSFIVLVRTSQKLHAVLIPIFDEPDAVIKFNDFLKNDNDAIEANFCRYDQSQDRWEIDKKTLKLIWPKSGILYPEILANDNDINSKTDSGLTIG